MKKHKILTVLSLFTLVLLGAATIVKAPIKVNAYIEPDAHTISSDYVRILVVPDPNDTWNASSAITGIVVHRDTETVTVGKNTNLQFSASGSRHLIEHDRQYRADSGTLSGKKFWYFSVRYDFITGKDFQVVRMDPTISGNGTYTIWNATKRYTFSDGNITKVWKLNQPADSNSDLNFSNSTGNGLSDLMVSFVLEAYMTCAPSSLNGYMAYPGLQATYHLDERTASTTTLKDFADESGYVEGRTTGSGTETTLGQKVSIMKALYEAATLPPSDTNATNNTTNYLNVIIVISVLGLSSLFAFYFLKRKPQNI